MNKQAELVQRMTDKELLLNLYVSQLIILTAAAVLSRWFFGDVLHFINLIEWSRADLTAGIFFALIVVCLQLAMYQLLPSSWLDDGGINMRMFARRHPAHIVWLSVIVGFSEEVLFRAVLQEQFGLVLASAAFALIHIRYLAKPVLFTTVVVLSFSLGLLYIYTANLLTVITAHIFIDMLLGFYIKSKHKSLHGRKEKWDANGL
ncbi:CPBP family intramembrane glutamic endopeptidase [Salisediminibacterium halotolerans]|uniref:CAAX prenyl protease 2/Lysostaphin resistance protein A-like domain-containing protein n=1 Tax=Salisediminibacterium halotolerans TaxID=517425 RepID=A0A1H9P6F3_9BACI|nr:type II CAAX endopeptidase family protein [Salisediminibacterium haloalkalitolerans]SER43677.1 hypothetical protein SAMN05444126_10197 [Salisediminibacterium haloalkalitolerans]